MGAALLSLALPRGGPGAQDVLWIDSKCLSCNRRADHNTISPQRVLNKNRVGDGSGRRVPELFDMLASAAYLAPFRPVKSTSASSNRETSPRSAVASSVHQSILWSPLVPGRLLGAYSLSVSPCLQATCHEALHRLRASAGPSL